MTRAATRAVGKAFGSTDHPYLTATVWHDNAASFGLLKSNYPKKLGLKQAAIQNEIITP